MSASEASPSGPLPPPDPRARDLALSALCDRGGNVTAHLRRLLQQHRVAPVEASLARELALGAVRHRRTLEAVVAAFLSRQKGRMSRRVRAILHLGIYQLLFLQRVPDFAAVNEAVEQIARREPGKKAFVNAVLRSVARSVSAVQAGPPQPAEDVLPLGESSFRRFDRAVFPDPRRDAAGFLGSALSLPDVLAERWLRRLGGLAPAIALALHANARPPLVLRVNARRASVVEVLERLRAGGVRADAHANGLSVVVGSGVELASLDVFAEGLVQPQDASATRVVASLDVRPGMRVLDLCSAPGTKTTHLGERMDDRGEIVAVDVSPEKLRRVEENCRRMGLTIVRTLAAEAVASLPERSFDLVLVDAPCSNTGVLARRVEARWRFSLRNLRALAQTQRRLLLLGAQYVRPGGLCAYSTCSLEPEENRSVVRAVLSREGRLTLVDEQEIPPAGAEAPCRWSDGGYLAVLRG